jgi:hypothetical protein
MTRFYINETEIAPPAGISSLDQILKHVEGIHLPPNSVVRQVHIDGLPLTPENFNAELAGVLTQVEEREKVEIITGTIEEIARDSIDEAIDYLDRIEKLTPSLAAGFQVSPGPESFETLRQLYEGLYWLNLLLDKLKTNFHLSLDDVPIHGTPVREHHQKFISILKQLIDSQERGDFILISDLLEYEILPLVPVWKDLFRIIASEVHTAH